MWECVTRYFLIHVCFFFFVNLFEWLWPRRESARESEGDCEREGLAPSHPLKNNASKQPEFIMRATNPNLNRVMICVQLV